VSHDADDHGWQFIGSSDASVPDPRIIAFDFDLGVAIHLHWQPLAAVRTLGHA
jgi:hypothetical protein